MHTTIGFHTVEDRDNPDEVEDTAPFMCKRPNAWLSFGYYFWEKDLKRAHDWGLSVYGRDKYIICKCGLQLHSLLDLVGDREHQEKMQQWVRDLVKDHPALNGKEPPLGKAIALLRIMQQKNRINYFPYDSVRAQDFPSPATYKFAETERRHETTDLNPRIQICLFEKSKRISLPLRIIYPEHYVQD